MFSAHFSIFQWQKTDLCKVLSVILSNALFTLDVLLNYNSWGDPLTRITSTFLTQLEGTIDRYSPKTVVLWKQNNWERRSKLIKAVLKRYRFYCITNKIWLKQIEVYLTFNSDLYKQYIHRGILKLLMPTNTHKFLTDGLFDRQKPMDFKTYLLPTTRAEICCKVRINSPYSPTSARGPPPRGSRWQVHYSPTEQIFGLSRSPPSPERNVASKLM